jgi:predicted nucleic acid-binding protein
VTIPNPEPRVVLDASVLVDILAGTELADLVRARLTRAVMHAPAHIDVEVLSAIGRLHRADSLDKEQAQIALDALSRLPITRHPLPELLHGAWARRDYLRLTDALYAELAEQLHAPLLTTDPRLARASKGAEAITMRR